MWPPGTFTAVPLFAEIYWPWISAKIWLILKALPVRIGGERPAGWASISL